MNTDTSKLQHYGLSELFLCLEADCGRGGNSNSYCPACASTHVVPITKWITELLVLAPPKAQVQG